jgi:uncharacterized protein
MFALWGGGVVVCVPYNAMLTNYAVPLTRGYDLSLLPRMTPMIVVLSPAKSLDFATAAPLPTHTQPALLGDSQELIDILRTLTPLELAQLMRISDPLAAQNAVRFAQWALPFTPQTAKQAVFAFNGDVYAGLDAATLTLDDLAFAQKHVRVLSGLYGVLRPLDFILPYRLEMGTRLPNPRGRDLYAFWGGRLTEVINAALADAGATALVNLASLEYFKAIRSKELATPVIEPVFEDWSAKEGKFKIVSFYAKRARGMMARYAVRERLTVPDDLKDFADGGYAYCSAVSSAERWVFRRTLATLREAE